MPGKRPKGYTDRNRYYYMEVWYYVHLSLNPVSVSTGSVSTSTPISNLTVESKETAEERTIDTGTQFSGVSSFAMALHLSELSLSSTTTQFVYRSDNSLAVQAKSQVNFKPKPRNSGLTSQ